MCVCVGGWYRQGESRLGSRFEGAGGCGKWQGGRLTSGRNV